MADDERHDPERTDSRLELPSLRSPFRRRAPTQQLEPEPEPEDSPRAEPEPAPRPRRRLRMHLPPPVAAVVAGLLAGLALVALTAGGLRACSSMRGTSSCGKPGILLLLAITAVVVVLGSLILRLLGVAAPGSTSFLGVGLAVVLILLALLPVLDDWWVVIVVPALVMLTYLAAWWLTTTYGDPARVER